MNGKKLEMEYEIRFLEGPMGSYEVEGVTFLITVRRLVNLTSGLHLVPSSNSK